MINKAAIDACDADDGVNDGIISDPPTCHFDPGVLLSKGKEDDECWTAAQVSAVKKIYEAAQESAYG
ncbi:MAG: tannase/feruloyl esterase family alpha/beta hydrolase [Acidobacteria bacterium]|nr:tannase/feruloyl esterase family alpha/beta hydrolase [Acidobacteriota bacterium]